MRIGMMRVMMWTILVLALVAAGSRGAQAAVPPLLNFQGILLDDDLGTVIDSTYDLTFRIFDDSTAGTSLWEENQSVKTENGLFNTFLGSTIPLPDSVFSDENRFFEIELIGVGAYEPRNRIGSVAYAYRVSSVDGASGGHIYGDLQLHSDLTVGDADGESGAIAVTDGLSLVFVTDGSAGATALSGPGSSTVFDMSQSGDASVLLPGGAVSSLEQFDEPGLASDYNSSVVTLPQSTSTMADLATVTITVPSDGYVFVQGRSTFTPDFDPPSWTGRNKVYVQIDEDTGGSVETAVATELGLTSYFNLGQHRLAQTAYADRIYYKSAGTYTFRLEARTFSSNTSGAVSEMSNSFVTAMFFPTSYGTVSTVVSASDAAAIPGAAPMPPSLSPDGDDTGISSIQYRADLRALELRAVESKLEAERAQRELLEAKLKLQLDR